MNLYIVLGKNLTSCTVWIAAVCFDQQDAENTRDYYTNKEYPEVQYEVKEFYTPSFIPSKHCPNCGA